MKKLIKSVIFLLIIAIIIYGGVQGYDRLMRYIYPIKYSDYVECYSKEFNVPEPLIYAVIKCESSFDPNAESSAGAKGLMQMLPDAFKWAKSRYDGKNDETDITDPQTNIKYGTYILKLHFDTFGDWQEAVAAYHAGAGNIRAWLNNPEYSSDGKTIDKFPEACADTESYVNRVFDTRQKYVDLYYGEQNERTDNQ